ATAGTPREADYLRAHVRVLSSELFDETAAAAAAERLLELNPEDAEALLRLAALEDRRRTWAEAAENYVTEAEGGGDEAYQSSLRAAEVEVRHAPYPRIEMIAELLERAGRLAPTNADAGRLLETVYRRQSKWEEAARVLERVADRSTDRSVRVAAGVRLARI